MAWGRLNKKPKDERQEKKVTIRIVRHVNVSRTHVIIGLDGRWFTQRPNPPHREPNRYPLPPPTPNPHECQIINKTAGTESFSLSSNSGDLSLRAFSARDRPSSIRALRIFCYL